MEKYDVKKAYKDLYSPGRRDFALVTVPRFGYFAVDGHGDGGGSVHAGLPENALDDRPAVASAWATSAGARPMAK